MLSLEGRSRLLGAAVLLLPPFWELRESLLESPFAAARSFSFSFFCTAGTRKIGSNVDRPEPCLCQSCMPGPFKKSGDGQEDGPAESLSPGTSHMQNNNNKVLALSEEDSDNCDISPVHAAESQGLS